MFTVTVGFDASGISSTCSPSGRRYSRMPSTSRTGAGRPLGAGAFAAPAADGLAPPTAEARTAVAPGAAKDDAAVAAMAAASARTRKGAVFVMGPYLGTM